MYSFAGQCIQVNWHYRYQSFSLSGFHLCDDSFMENDSTKQLYVIRNHIPKQHFAFHFNFRTYHSFASLFDGSERFRKDIIQSLSFEKPFFEFLRFRFYLIIRKCIKLSRIIVYLFDQWSKLIELLLIIIPSYQANNFSKHLFLKLVK